MLNKKERRQIPIVEEPKILDVTAGMKGELSFNDPVNLRISGNFDGKLDTKGQLIIGNTAKVNATIKGDEIIIAGEVEGIVIAHSSLSFEHTARFKGEISAPLLNVEKGAQINGSLSMNTEKLINSSSSSVSSLMSVDEVAQYLEIESSLVNNWAEKGKIPAQKSSKGDWSFNKQQVDQWIVSQK